MTPSRFIAALSLLAVASCGEGAGGPAAAPKYPRRSPGCKLAFYTGPKPGVAAYDDIGIAEVGCHIETSRVQCMAQLRAEACKMGGDIIYDMPKRPLRPKEQAMIFRARVAHTRAPEPKEKAAPKPGEEAPPPASDEESAGPVVPLGAAAAEPAPVDAGAAAPADAGPSPMLTPLP